MAFLTYIGDKTIPDNMKINIRIAARAVIFYQEKVLLIHSCMNDYKIPGGGINKGEDIIEALKREIEEETGYTDIIVLNKIGKDILRRKDALKENEYFVMESEYYICKLNSLNKKEQKLEPYEKQLGFSPVFIDIEEAINNNEKLLEKGVNYSKSNDNLYNTIISEKVYKDWIIRDTKVLKRVKRMKESITSIYFVRHAMPDFSEINNRIRPLTKLGISDSKKLIDLFTDIELDYAVSSPYKRSVDTILNVVDEHHLELETDERLRERDSIQGSNTKEFIRKRWEDMDIHEDGGESINMVQNRNMQVIKSILHEHTGENIIIGTHGTALSTIFNYYDNNFNADDFFRIIDYMPYVVRMDFDGDKCIEKKEIYVDEKE